MEMAYLYIILEYNLRKVWKMSKAHSGTASLHSILKHIIVIFPNTFKCSGLQLNGETREVFFARVKSSSLVHARVSSVMMRIYANSHLFNYFALIVFYV